jgi:hypothetical protein
MLDANSTHVFPDILVRVPPDDEKVTVPLMSINFAVNVIPVGPDTAKVLAVASRTTAAVGGGSSLKAAACKKVSTVFKASLIKILQRLLWH